VIGTISIRDRRLFAAGFQSSGSGSMADAAVAAYRTSGVGWVPKTGMMRSSGLPCYVLRQHTHALQSLQAPVIIGPMDVLWTIYRFGANIWERFYRRPPVLDRSPLTAQISKALRILTRLCLRPTTDRPACDHRHLWNVERDVQTYISSVRGEASLV
jgi:hypothetical protein